MAPHEPAVSASMHRAKAAARASHVTVGDLRRRPDGGVEIDCSCGMVLTNGPEWSLDEHIRLHRAEARYLAVSEVAPAGMPRLIPVAADRRPR
ncbi:hypothetical protein ET495_05665 [Xylanimonas allomyrinae]|uniref:Uncharacterized protein n=1 Tax=Xylanimonas allomyrinae TaxID=2509459 RepID=A0A4P6EXQ1_9MICO|nr:hypothetical protein [Xylanimonas allomyrinae]QAY62818.1 hypothetical protein ET495_05665 [Xylanimonas allomyrinae]